MPVLTDDELEQLKIAYTIMIFVNVAIFCLSYIAGCNADANWKRALVFVSLFVLMTQ